MLKAAGPITLEDSTISGDLLMRSLITLSPQLPPVEREILRQLDPQEPAYRLVAPRLSLRTLTVERDVDLTGVSLFQDEHNPWFPEDECGHLDARYLTVKGDLVTHDRAESTDKTREAYLVVPGRFDLSSASNTLDDLGP